MAGWRGNEMQQSFLAKGRDNIFFVLLHFNNTQPFMLRFTNIIILLFAILLGSSCHNKSIGTERPPHWFAHYSAFHAKPYAEHFAKRIDALAEEGDPEAFRLPEPKTAGRYDYSFSGLKTAFINTVHGIEQRGEPLPRADLAASFRRAVCRELTDKARILIRERPETAAGGMALAGGVSANRELRRMAQAMCDELGVRLYMPEIKLCTDNGAMIGSAAYYQLRRGETAGLNMNAEPALRLVMSEQ